ncbi:hypothetical protein PYCC9005_002816 [Savitreella phatthalungensis]
MKLFAFALASVVTAYTIVTSGGASCGAIKITADQVANWTTLADPPEQFKPLPEMIYPNPPASWKGKKYAKTILQTNRNSVLAPVIVLQGTSQAAVNWRSVWKLWPAGAESAVRWVKCT